ncbi:proton-conducting membrane transporter [Synechococcus sp. Cruz-7E5]|nr:proton-conducting membrane transporter [Synechococcus sp. Cruz-7E5]
MSWNPSGSDLTIAWLLLPFLAAFLAALVPRLGRPLILLVVATTLAMALAAWQGWLPSDLLLLGPFGVRLQLDQLASPLLLLTALVSAAVLLEGWGRAPDKPFLLLLLLLQGGIDSAIVASDLISIYVAQEVVGISTFLLLVQGNRPPQLWIGLRYLLIGNSVMLLYLLGAALVYREQSSFALQGLEQSSGMALALLLVALFTKAEVFISGLWLPRTNAVSPAAVSALISGGVVCAGLAPLLRIAAAVESVGPLLRWIGLASALLGLVFALAERRVERLLAWSTISQMGMVLLVPAVGGFYALAHGLAKAALFLVSARLPVVSLDGWRAQALPWRHGAPLLLASLSIAGAPPLLGFLAKEQLSVALAGPKAGLQAADLLPIALLLLSVGTAAVYARLWLLPGNADEAEEGQPASPGALLLVTALLLLNVTPWALEAWKALIGQGMTDALLKSAGLLLAGAGLQRLWPTGNDGYRLPDLEGFDDLLGGAVLVGAALVLLLSR